MVLARGKDCRPAGGTVVEVVVDDIALLWLVQGFEIAMKVTESSGKFFLLLRWSQSEEAAAESASSRECWQTLWSILMLGMTDGNVQRVKS
jgi:hypothetical protein